MSCLLIVFQLHQNVKAILSKQDVAQGLPASRCLTSTLLNIRDVLPQHSAAVIATDSPLQLHSWKHFHICVSPLMHPIFSHSRINYLHFEDEKTQKPISHLISGLARLE